MLNVHHLELFYYVARAGGITPALRLIPYGIQQPAVSQQMTQLEEAVGAKLFHRRPFSLTPIGREVYEFIAPFFSGLSQLAGNVQGKAEVQLRIAATAGVMHDYFPQLLRALEQRVPGLRISLREASPVVAARLLREHEVDLAFAIHERRHAMSLQFQPLVSLPMVLLTEKNSPFATSAAVLRQAVDGGVPLIAPPPTDELTEAFMAELRRRKRSWEIRIEAPALDLVEAYVAHGFGVGLSISVPGRAIPGSVRALKLSGFPKLVYGVLWNGKLSAPAQACLEIAKKMAQSL